VADDRELLIKILLQDQTKKGFDSVNKQVKGTQQSLFNLKNVILAVAGSVVVKQFLELSNTFQQVQNRLKLVTDSANELISVQNKLYEVAQKTRGAYLETVTLYQKLALNSRDLGLSQRDLLEITENVNKAIAISGADSIQASAGILQLSQAFASGRLQGDEFRSISENIPVILDLLAESTGKARGELKKMASEGLLTSDVLAKAIGGATQRLDEDFNKLSPTVSQSTTVLSNSMLTLVGSINELTSASSGLANFLVGVAGGLDRVSSFLQIFNGSISSPIQNIQKYKEELGLTSDVLDEFGYSVRGVTDEYKQQFDNSAKVVEAINEQLQAIDTLNKLKEAKERLDEDEQDSVNKLITEYEEFIKILDQVIQKRTEEANNVVINNTKQIAELEKFIKKNEQALDTLNNVTKEFLLNDLELLQKKQNDEIALVQEQQDKIKELIKLQKEDEKGITEEENQRLLEKIEEYERLKFGIKAKYGELEIELLKKQREEREKIQKEYYDKNLSEIQNRNFEFENLDKMSEENKVKLAKQGGRELLDELAKRNKVAFAINKALAIRDAIISTSQGMASALKWGYPLGPIFAGIIGGLGAVQIANIASQQYQGRALGGRVQAGSTYMVGEQGAEMFVPSQSGTIIPNKDLGSATNVNITINANDTQGFDDLLVKRRSVIVNVINDALNSQGREALI